MQKSLTIVRASIFGFLTLTCLPLLGAPELPPGATLILDCPNPPKIAITFARLSSGRLAYFEAFSGRWRRAPEGAIAPPDCYTSVPGGFNRPSRPEDQQQIVLIGASSPTPANISSEAHEQAIQSAAEANACVDYRDGHITNDCMFRVNTTFCVYMPQPLGHFNALDNSAEFDCKSDFSGGGLIGISAGSKNGNLLYGEKIVMFSCRDPKFPASVRKSIDGAIGKCE